MKKIIRVHFNDGTTQDEDAAKAEQGIQTLGTPANHPLWLQYLQQIATLGILADGHNKEYACYVAPAHIKKVELIFSDRKPNLVVTPGDGSTHGPEPAPSNMQTVLTCTTIQTSNLQRVTGNGQPFWKRVKNFLMPNA